MWWWLIMWSVIGACGAIRSRQSVMAYSAAWHHCEYCEWSTDCVLRSHACIARRWNWVISTLSWHADCICDLNYVVLWSYVLISLQASMHSLSIYDVLTFAYWLLRYWCAWIHQSIRLWCSDWFTQCIIAVCHYLTVLSHDNHYDADIWYVATWRAQHSMVMLDDFTEKSSVDPTCFNSVPVVCYHQDESYDVMTSVNMSLGIW